MNLVKIYQSQHDCVDLQDRIINLSFSTSYRESPYRETGSVFQQNSIAVSRRHSVLITITVNAEGVSSDDIQKEFGRNCDVRMFRFEDRTFHAYDVFTVSFEQLYGQTELVTIKFEASEFRVSTDN